MRSLSSVSCLFTLSFFQNDPRTKIHQLDTLISILLPEWKRPALGRPLVINGAFIVVDIEHTADLFTIDQPVLER